MAAKQVIFVPRAYNPQLGTWCVCVTSARERETERGTDTTLSISHHLWIEKSGRNSKEVIRLGATLTIVFKSIVSLELTLTKVTAQ
jgi:hypothetical protein